MKSCFWGGGYQGVMNWVCIYVLSHSSCVRLVATPWTVARQAPLSMGFSSQEYWSGLPFPSPGDLQTQESSRGLLHCSGFIEVHAC